MDGTRRCMGGLHCLAGRRDLALTDPVVVYGVIWEIKNLKKHRRKNCGSVGLLAASHL